MKAIMIALTFCGVILAIALCLVALTVWKYFNKHKVLEELEEGAKEDHRNEEIIYDKVRIKMKTDPQLDIKEMRQQVQSEDILKEMEAGLSKKVEKEKIKKCERKASNIYKGRRKSEYLASSVVPINFFEESIDEFEFEKVSQKHAPKEVKVDKTENVRKLRSIDMRKVSITEDMFRDAIEIKNQGKAKSLPCISESNEIVDTCKEKETRKKRKNSKLSASTKFIHSLRAGKITLKIKHDLIKKELNVLIIRLFDLDGIYITLEDAKIYVAISLEFGYYKKQKTEYRRKSFEPFYNECFIFEDFVHDRHNPNSLIVQVYNQRKVLPSECIGKVKILLSQVDLTNGETLTAFLEK